MNPENIVHLIKYSLPVLLIAIVSKAIPEISFLYYLVPAILILYLTLSISDVIRSIKLRNNILLSKQLIVIVISSLVLILYLLVTSTWSSYPVITIERSLYFGLLVFGCFSAGYLLMRDVRGKTKEVSGEVGKDRIEESGVRSLKKNIKDNILGYNVSSNTGVDIFFKSLLIANIFIVALSIFSLVTGIPSDSWTGGHAKGFMGFFGHQNALGSLILFTVPAVFYEVLKVIGRQKAKDKRNKTPEIKSPAFRIQHPVSRIILYSLLLAFNFLILALTYSRSSMLSLFAGIIIFLVLNKKYRLLTSGFLLLTIIVILILTIPKLKQDTENLILKDFRTVFESRTLLWQPSVKAALHGGVFGLGYGVSDPEIDLPGTGSHYEDDRYIREKGNSILALIEETGVIGLLLFIIPIAYLIYNFKDTRYRIPDTGTRNPESRIKYPASSVLISAISAFVLHAQFEGWWVGVGSVQLPIFFLFTGLFFNQSIQTK